MKLIKTILVFALAIIALNVDAQENKVRLKDSLEREILKILNETKWEYSYHSETIKGGIKEIVGEIKIENESLILNFKKSGIQTVSIVNNNISCNNLNPALGVFITKNWGSKNGMGLVILPQSVKNGKYYTRETKLSKEQSWKLYELIKKYHDKFNEVTIKKEKESEELQLLQKQKIEDFQLQYQNQKGLFEKSIIPEEQRKLIVQANAKNEAKKYSEAIELYKKAIEINQFSYPSAYYNMALIAAQITDYNYAIFNMKKYLIIEPNAPDARAAQDKIYEWELLIEK